MDKLHWFFTTGYSISLMPFSWAIGRRDVRKKTLFALGPLRFSIHRDLEVGFWL
jgi:hypothetical protein